MRLNTTAPDEQACTLRLFSRRNEKFVEMLPLLLEHLKSTNAMLAENADICLRNYGAQAKSALLALEKAESYPNEKVQVEARKATAMIKAQLEEPMFRR